LFGTGSKSAGAKPAPVGRDGLDEDAEHFSPAMLERMKRHDEEGQRLLAESRSDIEDVRHEVIVIDLENWRAWEVFQDCATQWRTNMQGVVGLDYNAVFSMMNAYGVKNRKRMIRKIRAIESGALAGFKGLTRDEIGVF
jgi:hypothetical protein